jgi:hypothetical protein
VSIHSSECENTNRDILIHNISQLETIRANGMLILTQLLCTFFLFIYFFLQILIIDKLSELQGALSELQSQ